MAILAMSVPALSTVGLNRAPVLAFRVDRVVAGRCRYSHSLWERIIGSDPIRTALGVFEIINLD